MANLLQPNVPCYYDFDVVGVADWEPRLHIHVSVELADALIDQLAPDGNIVRSVLEEPQFRHWRYTAPQYNQPTNWGFGDYSYCFRGGDGVIFSFSLPEPDGPDDEDDRDDHPDLQEARYLSANMSLLFGALELADDFPPLDPEECQLLTLHDIRFLPQKHGYCFSAVISPELVRFLWQYDDDDKEGLLRDARYFQSIVAREGLGISYKTPELDELRVVVGPPSTIIIKCPGQGHATEVGPAQVNDIDLNRGMKLRSHNVDNPLQQIQLLFALIYVVALAKQTGCGQISP